MKNKYIFIFILLLVTVLSSTCVFAENSTDNLAYSENMNDEYNVESSTYNEDNRLISVNASDSNVVNSEPNEYIQIDNYSMDDYVFKLNGHTLKDLGSDNILYKYVHMEFGEVENTVKINNGSFSISLMDAYESIIIYSGNNKYLATIYYDYSYTDRNFTSINFTYEPYIKYTDEDNDIFKLADGNYFNYIINNLEVLSDKKDITIMLKDNVILNEPFIWNNTHINLTILGYNGTYYNSLDHSYIEYPYYVFSTPSIINVENCNLTFGGVTLEDNGNGSLSFITNNGILTLANVILKNNLRQKSALNDVFLITNNNKLSIYESSYSYKSFNTQNYSTETTRKNLIDNKKDLSIELSSSYKSSFLSEEVDYPNYLINNEGQINYYNSYIVNTLIDNSNSAYEYDAIYNIYEDFDYFSDDIILTGKNVLINNSILKGFSYGSDSFINMTNINNITFLNSNITYVIDTENITLDSFKAINSTFENVIFSNNILKSNEITLDSNTFKMTDVPVTYDFNGKEIVRKVEDYNTVRLVYDKLNYHNNILENFKFIFNNTSSDTNITNDGTIQEDNKTLPQEDNKTVSQEDSKTVTNSKVHTPTSSNSNTITLNHDSKITLSWLNNLFNTDFRGKELLIYINGVLVYNGTVDNNLSEILFTISNKLHGNCELKVVSNGEIYTKTINII